MANFGSLLRRQPHLSNVSHLLLHIRPKGHRKAHDKVGSLSLAKCLLGFEPGTFWFWSQCLNPLGLSPLCESTICFRKRYKSVWWKPIRVSLFYSWLWWSCWKEIEDPQGKLAHLIRYTTGEVKEMVENCIQLLSKEGNKTAKQMVHKLCGDPHRVIAAYHKEIKQWP